MSTGTHSFAYEGVIFGINRHSGCAYIEHENGVCCAHKRALGESAFVQLAAGMRVAFDADAHESVTRLRVLGTPKAPKRALMALGSGTKVPLYL